MNEVLKQRLVGALILVALGVIFWPIIFVQPGDEDATQIAPLPPAPGVSAVPLEPPEEAGLRGSPALALEEEPLEPAALTRDIPTAAPQRDELAAAPAQPQTRSAAPQPLEVDDDGVPIGWILQVASVSSADKAEELRARLTALNYKAYVAKVERGGKALHRVYLGPKFERARLEALQAEIDAEFGVTSIVTRYIP